MACASRTRPASTAGRLNPSVQRLNSGAKRPRNSDELLTSQALLPLLDRAASLEPKYMGDTSRVGTSVPTKRHVARLLHFMLAFDDEVEVGGHLGRCKREIEWM